MIFEGDHSVITAIKEKKRLMESGESHDHLRILLYQGGGLMCGAYGVGAALALEELGYSDCFSYFVGVSSGAAVVAHFAAGTTASGQAILKEDCCEKDFINPWRFWNQVKTGHFMDVIKTHPVKRIDFSKVQANPAQLYIGVTDYQSARPHLISPRNEEHFFNAIHASINMQNVSPYKVVIDGVHYTDGGFSSPHMIDEVMKQLDPTHVLIVTNNNREFKPISRFERFLNKFVFRMRLNGILARAINSRREARGEAIASAMNSNTAVAVVWGDGSIGSAERNGPKVVSTVEASRTWWHGLISQD
jgi:predicted patatin/cPLA2 family phospholipase